MSEKPMSLGHFIALYVAYINGRTKAAVQARRDLSRFAKFIRRTVGESWTDLEESNVKQFVQQTPDETRERVRQELKRFFEFLLSRGYLPAPPIPIG